MSVLLSSFQKTDARDFFNAAAEFLCWDDLAGKVVMDVGCGSGTSSLAFVETFPAIQKLIAIDYIQALVEKAKIKNPHAKIEYEQGDVTNKFTLARWFGEVDIVVSVFCFNYLTDPKEAYENLFQMLKTDGEAAIIQSLYSNYYDFLRDLSENPKWSSYADILDLQIPESHRKYSALHYRQLFEEIGFEIIQCTNETRSYHFTSDKECRDALLKCCPLTVAIPYDKIEEYRADLFETFLKHHKRNDDGLLCMSYVTLSALLRKTVDNTESEESA